MSDLKPLNLKKDQEKGISNLFNKYVLLLFLLVFGVVFFVWGRSSSSPAVFKYVFGQGSTLKAENGRVNILLLGTAGGKHDGPNLTDTIMVASYDTSSHSVDLISLPRDLWIDENKAKINTLYQIGLNKQSFSSNKQSFSANNGDGLSLAQKEIGDVLGLSIPYAVRLDFAGFVKAIDLVGGVDVNVLKSFDDYVYPITGQEDEMCGYKEQEMDIKEDQAKVLNVSPGIHKALLAADNTVVAASAEGSRGIEYSDQDVLKYFSCRFEHLSFKEGVTHFDGETALKFVRSRHGTNQEGSDFARSKRQQQVIQAFKEKVLSLGTLTNPRKVIDLIKTFGDSIDSNISQGSYLELINIARELKGTKSFVIDSTGENPLLITPPQGDYGGAWVLIPPNNDFSVIQTYVKNILSDQPASQSGEPR